MRAVRAVAECVRRGERSVRAAGVGRRKREPQTEYGRVGALGECSARRWFMGLGAAYLERRRAELPDDVR
eukprot:577814-Prymnesium_polylepis.1